MMRNIRLVNISPRIALLLFVLLLTAFIITGCSGKNNPPTNNTPYTKGNSQGFPNGAFEQGNGTGAYNWTTVAVCGTAPCSQRINSENNIDGYSWDMKAAANNGWDELLTIKTPELNSPSTSYTLEFDFNCVTATTSGGWNMAFRDKDHSCCIDAAANGTAYYANNTTASKHMTLFTCSAGEKGHYKATFITPAQKNTDYYLRIWDYGTTTKNQEMVVDNFKVYKTNIAQK